MAILAAGVGFAIRNGVLDIWADKYGFTKTELGAITGGGFTGFGIVILISSLLADKIGFGKLMTAAFGMHLVSAVLTLMTGAAYAAGGKDYAYYCLFWGMFLFSVANGIAEAVVNPLVATIFPKEKTHYLNILHAGWPGGMIIGSLASYFMAGGEGVKATAWEIQMSLFLIPVVFYGVMMLGQKFPQTEASQSGVSYKAMLGELGILGAGVLCILLTLFFQNDLGLPSAMAYVLGAVLLVVFAASTGFKLGYVVLAFLLLVHAMVGYVELGTDSWITNITGAILSNTKHGTLLFIYTSALMFALRFFAGPIVEKTSPLGLLMVSAALGTLGLVLISFSSGVVMCVMAATIYGIGKTFYWPTMLAVVSEQFPKGGAITIGAAGGVGMLSAGLLGGPGIGFFQDKNASEFLQEKSPAAYSRYKADNENSFLVLKTVGLNGQKVGVLEDNGKEAMRALELMKSQKAKDLPSQEKLVLWWNEAQKDATADKPIVSGAKLHGSRQALLVTAAVPATMFLCYGLLNLYYKRRGGYKAVNVAGDQYPDLGGIAGEVTEA
jgi:MFS family permease